jgi:hypothetical protein
MTKQKEFYKKNKDIFLRYVEDKDNVSASAVYDNLVENNISKLKAIITAKSEFRSEDFINQIRGE